MSEILYESEIENFRSRTVSCLRDKGESRRLAFYIKKVDGAPFLFCNGCEDENNCSECVECKSLAVKRVAEDFNRTLKDGQEAVRN